MKKALEVLKSMLSINSVQMELFEYGLLDDVKEAIAELEEAMKQRTCEGCRYGAFGVNGLGFEVECRIGYNCSRGREDRYEPKDNA